MFSLLENMARERFWNFELAVMPNPEIIAAEVLPTGYGKVIVYVDPNSQDALSNLGFSNDQQELMVRGVVEHAYGHLNICPGRDIRSRFSIIEAIASVIEDKRGKRHIKEKEATIQFFADLVADVIVDTVIAKEDREGWYAYAAMIYYKKILMTRASMSLEHYFFIRLNLDLFGKTSNYYQELLQCLKGAITEDQIRKLESMVEEANNFIETMGGNTDLISVFRPPYNWAKLAGKITELFFDAQPARKRGKTEECKKGTGPEDYPKGRNAKGGCITPTVFGNTLALWYTARTKEVRLSCSSGNIARDNHPVSPLIVTEVDPMRMPALKDFNWPRTLLFPGKDDERPDFQLYWNEEYITVPIHAVASQNTMPDLSFWVDSSQSMGFQPFSAKERNNNYDLLLRAVFGAIRWLEQQGYARYLNYSVLNFSEKTQYSGWKSWEERQQIWDTLFAYQDGGTKFDLGVMEKLMEEAKRPFVAIMVTDGEIDNWQKALNEINSQFWVSKNFIFIQLGKPGNLSRALSEKSFPVHVVRKCDDLGDLVLGELQRRYR